MESTKPNLFEDHVVREQSRTFLTRVRRASCYKTLRSLVTRLGPFVASGGLVMVAVAIKALTMFPGSETEAALEIWTIHWRMTFLSAMGTLLTGLFTIAFAIALRQAALALVDIADEAVLEEPPWLAGAAFRPDSILRRIPLRLGSHEVECRTASPLLAPGFF